MKNIPVTKISVNMSDKEDLFSDSDSDADAMDLIEIPTKVKEIPQKFVRIIGKAGVGKSTYILENYPRDKYLMTAYTGMASARLETKTISSMFKLGKDNSHPITLSLQIIYRSKFHIEIRQRKGIVIDEFYTLPGETMDRINTILQEVMNNDKMFGGLDVILVGDDRQTSSVDSKPFIESELYEKMTPMEDVFLPHHSKMRLKPIYMGFCDQFRNPKIKMSKMVKYLKDPRFASSPVPGLYVYHENKYVEYRNKLEMKKFKGKSLGVIDKHEYKKGCPIMITNNGKDIYNGMFGQILDYNPKKGTVRLEFENLILERPLKGVQFVPAFAVTIHKAQCCTFQGINIFMTETKIARNRSDAIRLIYTALTRVSRFSKCYVCLNIREF